MGYIQIRIFKLAYSRRGKPRIGIPHFLEGNCGEGTLQDRALFQLGAIGVIPTVDSGSRYRDGKCRSSSTLTPKVLSRTRKNPLHGREETPRGRWRRGLSAASGMPRMHRTLSPKRTFSTNPTHGGVNQLVDYQPS